MRERDVAGEEEKEMGYEEAEREIKNKRWR
jgi:hypothetical protein